MFSTAELHDCDKNAAVANTAHDKCVSGNEERRTKPRKPGKFMHVCFPVPVILSGILRYKSCTHSRLTFHRFCSHSTLLFAISARQRQRQKVRHSEHDRQETWRSVSWQQRDQTPCSRRQQRAYRPRSDRWVIIIIIKFIKSCQTQLHKRWREWSTDYSQ